MKKLNLSFEQLFDKVERHELVICHLRHEDGTMTPFFVNNKNKRFIVPEGYMEYDKKHFRRHFNI